MVPKFRGDEDDWLDDEDAASGRSAGSRIKKAPQARSLGLPWKDSNAVVVEVFPNQCRIQMDGEGGALLLCSYRRAGVVSKSKSQARERSPVAVGDRVLVKAVGETGGVIEGICQRKNSLSRPAPGRDGNKYYHTLAANIDVLLIVASVHEPSFSSGLVDRFLVAAEAEGVSVALCITKMDLWNSGEKPWQIYSELGYDFFEVCAKQGLGIASLLEKIQGKTVVFCGHSGVGKTSLLRALLKTEVGRIGEVNLQTGKGRHTTTGAVLLGGPEHSQWIDTPGVREFGLARIDPENLYKSFPEFRNLRCPQVGCTHQEEPGCLARSMARYSTYRRILDSLLSGEN